MASTPDLKNSFWITSHGLFMRLTPISPLVSATERADAPLDSLHQPESDAGLAFAGAPADRAVSADVGQGAVEWGDVARVHVIAAARPRVRERGDDGGCGSTPRPSDGPSSRACEIRSDADVHRRRPARWLRLRRKGGVLHGCQSPSGRVAAIRKWRRTGARQCAAPQGSARAHRLAGDRFQCLCDRLPALGIGERREGGPRYRIPATPGPDNSESRSPQLSLRILLASMAPCRELSEDPGNRLAMRDKANRGRLVPLHFATGNRARPWQNASLTDAATNNSYQRLRNPLWQQPKSKKHRNCARSRTGILPDLSTQALPAGDWQYSCYVLHDCTRWAAQGNVRSTYESCGSVIGSHLAVCPPAFLGVASMVRLRRGSGVACGVRQAIRREERRAFRLWGARERLRSGPGGFGFFRGGHETGGRGLRSSTGGWEIG